VLGVTQDLTHKLESKTFKKNKRKKSDVVSLGALDRPVVPWTTILESLENFQRSKRATREIAIV
jgi:hypothetical protein